MRTLFALVAVLAVISFGNAELLLTGAGTNIWMCNPSNTTYFPTTSISQFNNSCPNISTSDINGTSMSYCTPNASCSSWQVYPYINLNFSSTTNYTLHCCGLCQDATCSAYNTQTANAQICSGIITTNNSGSTWTCNDNSCIGNLTLDPNNNNQSFICTSANCSGTSYWSLVDDLADNWQCLDPNCPDDSTGMTWNSAISDFTCDNYLCGSKYDGHMTRANVNGTLSWTCVNKTCGNMTYNANASNMTCTRQLPNCTGTRSPDNGTGIFTCYDVSCSNNNGTMVLNNATNNLTFICSQPNCTGTSYFNYSLEWSEWDCVDTNCPNDMTWNAVTNDFNCNNYDCTDLRNSDGSLADGTMTRALVNNTWSWTCATTNCPNETYTPENGTTPASFTCTYVAPIPPAPAPAASSSHWFLYLIIVLIIVAAVYFGRRYMQKQALQEELRANLQKA